ncbi:MAG: hypothetical protein IJI33_08095 [Solobacterium sp.]|nr:hypothetical protein [Solobacterium sp.]
MEEMNELFYKDPYLREFDAEVVSCTEGKKGFEVVLNDTAFYPEGGGQPADHGMLDEAVVSDVRKRDDRIVHYTDKPLVPGAKVHGVIDWERRFDHMQQHTGEHIMSGIIHRHYGYENVGFHLGSDNVLIDFDGPLTWEELMVLEQEANAAIWKNMPIRVTYPDEGELKNLEFRSKKELSGLVRIVEVPECDICACCGTHVTRTGEVGMIKCTSLENRKGGVRITLLCGGRAYRDYCRQSEQNADISHLLAAKIYETADAVRALQKADGEKSRQINALTQRYLAQKAETLPAGEYLVIDYAEDVRPVDLREYGNRLMEEGKAVVCAMYTNGSEENVYNYILLSQTENLRDAGKLLNEKLNGRGGGRPEMIQGTYRASREEIEAAFREVLARVQ